MSLKEELRPWIEEAVEAQELKRRIMVLETALRAIMDETQYSHSRQPRIPRKIRPCRDCANVHQRAADALDNLISGRG